MWTCVLLETVLDYLNTSLFLDRWFEEVRSFKDFLLASEDFVSDLSKKPTNQPSSDLYGMNGSFRTMNID